MGLTRAQRSIDKYFMETSEGKHEPRPHALDLTNPGVSIIVCTNQCYSGLAKGGPHVLVGLWASSGAADFFVWLSTPANQAQVITLRRSIVFLAAGNHGRHGHFARFPLRLVRLVDSRSYASDVASVIEDRRYANVMAVSDV